MVYERINAISNTKCGDLLINCLNSPPTVSNTAVNSPFGVFANYTPYTSFPQPTFNLPDMSGLPPMTLPPVENFYPGLNLSLYNNTQLPYPPIVPPPSGQAPIRTTDNDNIHEITTDRKNPVSRSRKSSNTDKTESSKFPKGNATLENKAELTKYAATFVHKVNSDREGNRLFSGGKKQAWCVDFVNYCLKHVYGNRCPSWIGTTSAVYEFKKIARHHNAYIELPRTGRSAFIAENIKPGDIMIQLERSVGSCGGHTGIVEKVNPDGTFVVIEGNSGNVNGGQVKRVKYKPTCSILRGFVRV